MKKRKYGFKPKDLIYSLFTTDAFKFDLFICSKDYFKKYGELDNPRPEYKYVHDLLINNNFYHPYRQNTFFYDGEGNIDSLYRLIKMIESFGFTRDLKFEDYITDSIYGKD